MLTSTVNGLSFTFANGIRAHVAIHEPYELDFSGLSGSNAMVIWSLFDGTSMALVCDNAKMVAETIAHLAAIPISSKANFIEWVRNHPPRFTHNNPTAIYLGSYSEFDTANRTIKYDLWMEVTPTSHRYIARFGHRPEDMQDSWTGSTPARVAERRANRYYPNI